MLTQTEIRKHKQRQGTLELPSDTWKPSKTSRAGNDDSDYLRRVLRIIKNTKVVHSGQGGKTRVATKRLDKLARFCENEYLAEDAILLRDKKKVLSSESVKTDRNVQTHDRQVRLRAHKVKWQEFSQDAIAKEAAKDLYPQRHAADKRSTRRYLSDRTNRALKTAHRKQRFPLGQKQEAVGQQCLRGETISKKEKARVFARELGQVDQQIGKMIQAQNKRTRAQLLSMRDPQRLGRVQKRSLLVGYTSSTSSDEETSSHEQKEQREEVRGETPAYQEKSAKLQPASEPLSSTTWRRSRILAWKRDNKKIKAAAETSSTHKEGRTAIASSTTSRLPVLLPPATAGDHVLRPWCPSRRLNHLFHTGGRGNKGGELEHIDFAYEHEEDIPSGKLSLLDELYYGAYGKHNYSLWETQQSMQGARTQRAVKLPDRHRRRVEPTKQQKEWGSVLDDIERDLAMEAPSSVVLSPPAPTQQQRGDSDVEESQFPVHYASKRGKRSDEREEEDFLGGLLGLEEEDDLWSVELGSSLDSDGYEAVTFDLTLLEDELGGVPVDKELEEAERRLDALQGGITGGDASGWAAVVEREGGRKSRHFDEPKSLGTGAVARGNDTSLELGIWKQVQTLPLDSLLGLHVKLAGKGFERSSPENTKTYLRAAACIKEIDLRPGSKVNKISKPLGWTEEVDSKYAHLREFRCPRFVQGFCVRFREEEAAPSSSVSSSDSHSIAAAKAKLAAAIQHEEELDELMVARLPGSMQAQKRQSGKEGMASSEGRLLTKKLASIVLRSSIPSPSSSGHFAEGSLESLKKDVNFPGTSDSSTPKASSPVASKTVTEDEKDRPPKQTVNSDDEIRHLFFSAKDLWLGRNSLTYVSDTPAVKFPLVLENVNVLENTISHGRRLSSHAAHTLHSLKNIWIEFSLYEVLGSSDESPEDRMEKLVGVSKICLASILEAKGGTMLSCGKPGPKEDFFVDGSAKKVNHKTTEHFVDLPCVTAEEGAAVGRTLVQIQCVYSDRLSHKEESSEVETKHSYNSAAGSVSTKIGTPLHLADGIEPRAVTKYVTEYYTRAREDLSFNLSLL